MPTENKDLPLRDDTRLLGRLLGDTVREQEGDDVFGAVERIRQASVRLNQSRDSDLGTAARAELEAILNGLPRDTMVSVVRAFSYFLHLANIAEDQHHIRRRRVHARQGSAPRDGSLHKALDRLQEAGLPADRLREFFATALVSPVLTAHPTEVSRKCILQCQREIAGLLDQRDRIELTPEEQEENDIALRRAVLRLWRTRMLRPTRLAVVDEIKNGVSYYNDTFFAELPRLYAQLQDLLARRFPGEDWQLPPFFRVGSWIGGLNEVAVDDETEMLRSDRQGVGTANPFGHVWRGLMGTLAMGLGFSGLAYLPLPEVTAIGYAAPLLTVIFAAMFLGEEVRLFRLSAVALGLAGVLIIVAPRLTVTQGDAISHAQALGAMLVLVGAIFTALAQVFVRKLVDTEGTPAIVFWFSVTATLLSFITLPFGWVFPGPQDLTILIMAGILGGVGQIFLTSSYREADASVVAPFDYASMIFALAIGWFFFSEVPTGTMLFGASLVMLAGVLIIWRERQLGLKRAEHRKAMTPQG